MSAILYSALFAAAANAANITTSIWLPGAAVTNVTFLGSVIEQSSDSTVLSLAFADAAITSNPFRNAPAQVTIGGTTRVAYNVSGNDGGASLGPQGASPITIELECQRSSEEISTVPTCTLSTLGAGEMFVEICAGMTVTSLPAYCTASSAINLVETQILAGESQYYINNFPLIITEGAEKLGASAAATPNPGSASVTTTGGGSIPSATGLGSSLSAPQATGGAAPMRTIAPALVGLGAVVGVFFS